MIENKTYDIYHDEEGDFLEVFFGVFIRKDVDTNEVKSIGILSFSKRMHLLKKLLSQLNKKLPREIDISK